MVSHLFLHSEFSFFLWCRMIGPSFVLWCSPESIPSMLEAWRMAPFLRCGVAWCFGRLFPLPFSGLF